MHFIKDIPLESEPGHGFKYSNIGYEVLGHIIEKASGQSFYEYVREHVFTPSNMSETGYDMKNALKENTAIGYKGENKEVNYEDQPLMGTPAGAVYSNVQDLYQFKNALKSGKLLTENGLDLLFNEGPNAVNYLKQQDISDLIT